MHRPVLAPQDWRDVAFLHWRHPAADVDRLLPDGLRAQTYDGDAWVSLLLLRIRSGVPLRRRARPGVALLEANLRTYAVDRDGVPGIYFLSIDTDSLLVCAGGRAVGVRYLPACTWQARRHDEFSYGGRRVGGAASWDVRVRAGAPVEPAALDRWLVERYLLHTRWGPARLHVGARHEPWPLRRATVTHCVETLRAAAGLPAGTAPPLAHFSPGVADVLLLWPALRFR